MRKKEDILLRHKILQSGFIYGKNVDKPDTVSKNNLPLRDNPHLFPLLRIAALK
jgi:hypothetical protein